MRVTRKALQAENDQLRAQIAVHNHVTRKSLNEYVEKTRKINEGLNNALKAETNKVASLEAELALAKAEPEAAA